MKLLGIDPGLMTGVCMIDFTDIENPIVLMSEELTIEEFYDKIDSLVDEAKFVVAEDFIINADTGKKGAKGWSLELLGITKYLCYHKGKNIFLQPPSDKVSMTNEILREAGFWSKGSAGHDNDSLRHALLWLMRRSSKLLEKLN